jgi:hypothetical protein
MPIEIEERRRVKLPVQTGAIVPDHRRPKRGSQTSSLSDPPPRPLYN